MVKGVECFPSHGDQALAHSITLTAADRAALLAYLRRSSDPALRTRAHIILLLADGHAWSLITAVLFCSSRTIARWQQRFQRGGVPALLGRPSKPNDLRLPRFNRDGEGVVSIIGVGSQIVLPSMFLVESMEPKASILSYILQRELKCNAGLPAQ